MPETGAPLGELSECLNEGRSEGQPLRWAPFASNEELRLRDSPAGCHGECLRAGRSCEHAVDGPQVVRCLD